MDRKGFFKTLFGGFVAASAAPSLIKAEETPQPPKDLSLSREVLRIDEHGHLGIGGSSNIGLGLAHLGINSTLKVSFFMLMIEC